MEAKDQDTSVKSHAARGGNCYQGLTTLVWDQEPCVDLVGRTLFTATQAAPRAVLVTLELAGIIPGQRSTVALEEFRDAVRSSKDSGERMTNDYSFANRIEK